MVMLDWNDPATWDAAYRTEVRVPDHAKPVHLHYHRHNILPTLRHRAVGLTRLLSLDKTSRIVIVGAGYGWTGELLEELHPGIRVTSTDTSTVVHDRKAMSEQFEIEPLLADQDIDLDFVQDFQDFKPRSRGRVLDESLETSASRDRVSFASGGFVDWIISEDVMTCLEDVDAIILANNMRALGAPVVHVVSLLRERGGQDEGYNWKTLEDWKALLPEDQFIPTGKYRTII